MIATAVVPGDNIPAVQHVFEIRSDLAARKVWITDREF